MYQTLQYREDGAVATIQLNRPQKKNSLNAQMRTEMETLLHRARAQTWDTRGHHNRWR